MWGWGSIRRCGNWSDSCSCGSGSRQVFIYLPEYCLGALEQLEEGPTSAKHPHLLTFRCVACMYATDDEQISEWPNHGICRLRSAFEDEKEVVTGAFMHRPDAGEARKRSFSLIECKEFVHCPLEPNTLYRV